MSFLILWELRSEIISTSKKKTGNVSSRCRVLDRLRKRNIYKLFLLETCISFAITILLRFTEIWELEYCSYCFFKEITNRRLFIFCPVFFDLFCLRLFRSKGSRSKFILNSVNLFRISVASSISFRNGGDTCSSGTWSWSLLPSSTV